MAMVVFRNKVNAVVKPAKCIAYFDMSESASL